jgi:peptide/nickel transport system permease protein
MTKYILRRVLQSIPIFFGITIISYALMALTPGGPVAALAFGQNLKPEERRQLEIQLGVNDNWLVQYLRWLVGDDWMRWDSDGDSIADQSVFFIDLNGPNGEPLPPGDKRGILRGDFGTSFLLQGRKVFSLIMERMGPTLELGISALVVGASVGILIGIVAAVNHNKSFDHITRVLAVLLDAVPIFFLALILLLFFGSNLKLLPLGGRADPISDLMGEYPPIWQRLEYLILPTFVLATGGISAYSRFMRASMLEVVSQDYMRTARAKGLSSRTIWLRHGARNALIPIATFLGPAIAGIWGGAVVTETIFSWPGIGRQAVAAVTGRDYPVVMAVTVFAGVSTIVGFLISDILYAVIDPRIRFD